MNLGRRIQRVLVAGEPLRTWVWQLLAGDFLDPRSCAQVAVVPNATFDARFRLIKRQEGNMSRLKRVAVWAAAFLVSAVLVAAVVEGTAFPWPASFTESCAVAAVGVCAAGAAFCLTRAGRSSAGLLSVIRLTGITIALVGGYALAVASGWVRPLQSSRWWGVATLWTPEVAVAAWFVVTLRIVQLTAAARQAEGIEVGTGRHVPERSDPENDPQTRRRWAWIPAGVCGGFSVLAFVGAFSAAIGGPMLFTQATRPFSSVFGWAFQINLVPYAIMLACCVGTLLLAAATLRRESHAADLVWGDTKVVWRAHCHAAYRATIVFTVAAVVLSATAATQRLPESIGALCIATMTLIYAVQAIDLHAQLEADDRTRPHAGRRLLALGTPIVAAVIATTGMGDVADRVFIVALVSLIVPLWPLVEESAHGLRVYADSAEAGSQLSASTPGWIETVRALRAAAKPHSEHPVVAILKFADPDSRISLKEAHKELLGQFGLPPGPNAETQVRAACRRVAAAVTKTVAAEQAKYRRRIGRLDKSESGTITLWHLAEQMRRRPIVNDPVKWAYEIHMWLNTAWPVILAYSDEELKEEYANVRLKRGAASPAPATKRRAELTHAGEWVLAEWERHDPRDDSRASPLRIVADDNKEAS